MPIDVEGRAHDIGVEYAAHGDGQPQLRAAAILALVRAAVEEERERFVAVLASERKSAEEGHRFYRMIPDATTAITSMEYGRMKAVTDIARAVGFGDKIAPMLPLNAEEIKEMEVSHAEYRRRWAENGARRAGGVK